MGRQFYTREFKLEAVRQMRERKVSAAEVARSIGVKANNVARWVREFEDDPVQAFPGQGQMKASEAEIERLKREIVRLKAERDILKKAAAFFAKESS